MKNMIVATDTESLTEALYVDGLLVNDDDTIYACTIVAAAEGEPVFLEILDVSLANREDGTWPETIEEVIKYKI